MSDMPETLFIRQLKNGGFAIGIRMDDSHSAKPYYSEEALARVRDDRTGIWPKEKEELERLLGECCGAITGVLEFYHLPPIANQNLRSILEKVTAHYKK